jgi:hypothetical protein
MREEQNLIAEMSKKNPKKFWKYVNKKTKTKSSIADLKWVDSDGQNKIATTDQEKADALEKFFSSVFTEEGPEDFEEPKANKPIHCCMKELEITEKDIIDKLSQINVTKSPGMDKIHPRIIFEVRREIAKPLQIIFTKSLKSGVVPSEWKEAEVVALYKKGSRSASSNYRPVSLTSTCCKLLESLIRDHIMSHVLNNDLLSNKQYGFVKGRSTMLQLLHMLDRWTQYLEEGGQVDAIYTDFEKAFDKVPHRRLISKLKAFGINSNIVNWVQDFLSDRKHRVKVNGKHSKWGRVTSGIPQGSVLGPILFLLFINDLPDFCEMESESYLFADDAKLFKHITTQQHHIDLQCSLDRLQQWSN